VASFSISVESLDCYHTFIGHHHHQPLIC